MKKALIAVLVFSISLNLLLIAAIANQNFGLPVAEAIKNISEPGTYGPPAMEIIDGDATINTIDVTMQNLLITGNLILTDQVNEGTINLSSVQVQGEIIIAGSGFTLRLHDCPINKITVQEESPAIKLIASGTTKVDHVSVAAETSLQEDGLAEGALGFRNVQVLTPEKILLVGGFDAVEIAAPKANVRVLKGTIATMYIRDTAASSIINLAEDVQLETLSIEEIMTLEGAGKVQAIDINAPGLSVVQGELGEVTCRAEGIFLELQSGSIAKIVVPELENVTSIALAENSSVENMELSSSAGVTGRGSIATVTISSPGVNIEQIPGKVIIPENMVAIIGGKEYMVEPEPEPEPEPAPTPSVKINKITSIKELFVGKTASKTITVQPSGTSLSVSTSNSKVATVSLSGNKVTITGKGSGKATITVKGSKSGYKSTTRTFTVTVKGPMDVKKFYSEDSKISPGKKLVIVTLYADNPSIYKVSIAGVGLTYDPDEGYFFGQVSPTDAVQSKVKVTK